MTESIHSQIELYAAAALTEEEMLAFDDHLATCGRCQSNMPTALDAIAALIPDSVAPQRAWDKIVAAIEA